MSPGPGPAMFAGVKVLELGTWVMVPSAATMLADFGADVIKIEHPSGDPGRASSPRTAGGINLGAEQFNRGRGASASTWPSPRPGRSSTPWPLGATSS